MSVYVLAAVSYVEHAFSHEILGVYQTVELAKAQFPEEVIWMDDKSDDGLTYWKAYDMSVDITECVVVCEPQPTGSSNRTYRARLGR